MKLFNSDADGVFVMPRRVLNYLKGAKKSEAKLIVYIFANAGRDFSVDEAARALSETPETVRAALAFWRGAGVISEADDVSENVGEQSEKRAENGACGERADGSDSQSVSDNVSESVPESTAVPPRSYTTEEIAEALKNDGEFKQLVTYTEHTLGTLLNSSKTAQLLYLYDNLGMQCDVIMGIIAYCASENKKSLRYIEKCAEGIHNDGVVTYKELESYFAAKRRSAEYETAVKKIIGASDRALTPKEKKIVNTWANEYKTPKELISYAYELTIGSISKPSLSYMAKIVESWNADGVDTVEKAKELRDKKKPPASSSGGSFDFDLEEIFEKP